MRDGAVVTVGTFDGLHRGHIELIRRLIATAAEQDRPSTVVTFDPHPLEVVRPAVAPRLLTTPREKIEILAQTGIDRVVLVRFDQQLASYEPRRFVEEILRERLGMAHLVIGYDHGFGRDRSGDADTLRRIGVEIGFGVDVVGPVLLGSEPISSSSIRAALERGEPAAAATRLGRPYALTGTVVRGDGRGRQLGFPTANLRLAHPRKLIPLEGIYAVRAETRTARLDGVAHLGPRPTFDDQSQTIELFAFDFDGDLYDQQIRLSFCARIRDIQRFATPAALIAAMRADCSAAARVFEDGGGACGSEARTLQSRA